MKPTIFPPAIGELMVRFEHLHETRHDRVNLHKKSQAALEIRNEIALANGWKIGKRFYPHVLARNKRSGGSSIHVLNYTSSTIWDHPEYYRFPGGKAAAVIVHVYADLDDPQTVADMIAWALTHGLSVEVPDIRSWYAPGSTCVVVYRSAREQENMVVAS